MTSSTVSARRVMSAALGAVLVVLGVFAGGCSPGDTRVATLSAATPASRAAHDSVRLRRLFADSGGIDFLGGSISHNAESLSEMDASGNLAIRSLQSSEQRALTAAADFNKGDNALNSRISPDGKKVAFIWSSGAPSYAFELRIMNMDGTAQRVLRSGPVFASNVPGDWTPDSRRLVIATMAADQTHSIALLTPSDGSMRTIKSLDWRYPSGLRVSPDGRRLAYSVAPDRGTNGRDIYLLDLDGSREVRLTHDNEPNEVIGWSRDGRALYYRTTRDDGSAVWRLVVAGGTPAAPPELVRSDIWGMFPIDVVDDRVYYGVAMRRVAIRSMSLDVDAGRALTPAVVEASGTGLLETGRVAWSPDGRRLAYIRIPRSSGAGLTALVLRDIGAGVEHQMALPLRRTEMRDWSADGRSITVVGYERGAQGRYRVDLTTGSVELLDRLVGYTDVPQPSPDGRLEYAVRVDSTTDSATVVVRPRGSPGEARVLFRDRRIGRIALSPDGKYLGVQGATDAELQRTYVAILPTSGGATRVLRIGPRPHRASASLDWTPDSRVLLFSAIDIAAHTYEFWKGMPSADSAQRIVALDVPAAYARLSADGRHVAFVSLDGPSVQELWVLENVPRSR